LEGRAGSRFYTRWSTRPSVRVPRAGTRENTKREGPASTGVRPNSAPTPPGRVSCGWECPPDHSRPSSNHPPLPSSARDARRADPREGPRVAARPRPSQLLSNGDSSPNTGRTRWRAVEAGPAQGARQSSSNPPRPSRGIPELGSSVGQFRGDIAVSESSRFHLPLLPLVLLPPLVSSPALSADIFQCFCTHFPPKTPLFCPTFSPRFFSFSACTLLRLPSQARLGSTPRCAPPPRFYPGWGACVTICFQLSGLLLLRAPTLTYSAPRRALANPRSGVWDNLEQVRLHRVPSVLSLAQVSLGTFGASRAASTRLCCLWCSCLHW
jgi:hypothetical protein